MAARSRALVLEIVSDPKKAQAGFKTMEGSLKKFAGFAAGLFAVDRLVDFASAAITAAGQLQNFQGTAETVFGAVADQVIAASEAASDFGLSQADYLQQINYFGNIAITAGLTEEAAFDLSKQFIALGVDFAAFADTSPEQAMQALQSATRGEYDMLQRYLPSISAATILEQARSDGLIDAAGNLDGAARLQAIYNLAIEDGGAAIGAAARESESLAAQQAVLNAELANATAELGEKLLPIYTDLLGVALDLVPALSAVIGPVGAVADNVSNLSTALAGPDGAAYQMSLMEQATFRMAAAGEYLARGVDWTTWIASLGTGGTEFADSLQGVQDRASHASESVATFTGHVAGLHAEMVTANDQIHAASDALSVLDDTAGGYLPTQAELAIRTAAVAAALQDETGWMDKVYTALGTTRQATLGLLSAAGPTARELHNLAREAENTKGSATPLAEAFWDMADAIAASDQSAYEFARNEILDFLHDLQWGADHAAQSIADMQSLARMTLTRVDALAAQSSTASTRLSTAAGRARTAQLRVKDAIEAADRLNRKLTISAQRAFLASERAGRSLGGDQAAGPTQLPSINVTVNAGVGDPVAIGREVAGVLSRYRGVGGRG